MTEVNSLGRQRQSGVVTDCGTRRSDTRHWPNKPLWFPRKSSKDDIGGAYTLLGKGDRDMEVGYGLGKKNVYHKNHK